MMNGEKERARSIAEDMSHEPKTRLQAIYHALSGVTTKDFWEIIDRGENFDYLEPERKEQIHVFFGWFPKEKME